MNLTCRDNLRWGEFTSILQLTIILFIEFKSIPIVFDFKTCLLFAGKHIYHVKTYVLFESYGVIGFV